MRKLASIQKISELLPIEYADNIEIAIVNGWQTVVKKGEFKPLDLCVYFEVDSLLPVKDVFSFMKNISKNEYVGEGYRVKTAKVRGVVLQGLALPLENFPEININNVSLGDNLTELLGVKKWFVPEIQSGNGTFIGDKPFGIPTTDEPRLQSNMELLQKINNKPFYITTKYDGTSCTIYYKDGKIGVCGRNKEIKDDGKSSMWNFVHNSNLEKLLRELDVNIAIQGEFCGHGIQKNRLKLTKPNLFVFDVYNIDTGKYDNFMSAKFITNYLELDFVEVNHVGHSFNYSLEHLLELAKGKYSSGMDREGIVVRSISDNEKEERISFKVINNDFLLKEK